MVLPLIILTVTSLYTRVHMGWEPILTLKNYENVFFSSLGQNSLLLTLEISLLTTVVAILVAYPAAYFLVFKVKNDAYRTLLLISMFVPFYTNWAVRTIAWIPFLGVNGILNTLLIYIGLLKEPAKIFLFSSPAMGFVMVQSYSAFIVATVFLAMIRIDPKLRVK